MIEKLFYKRTLFPDTLLNPFAKAFCQGRSAQEEDRFYLLYITREIFKALKIRLAKLNRGKAGPYSHHYIDPYSMTKRVIPWKNEEGCPPFRNIKQGKCLFNISSVISVGQYNSFWISYCPGSIANVCIVVRTH